jgi:3',5'-cyclic AMP phosphodiesterase CpdA
MAVAAAWVTRRWRRKEEFMTAPRQASKTSDMAAQAPYRIAHFGDLHLEDVDEEYEWVLDMVARARGEGADHLLFTGDIVDVARVDIIENLLDDLEDRGLGPEAVSFVPGNHDVYPLSAAFSMNSLGGAVRTLGRQSRKNWDTLCRLSARMHGSGRAARLLTDEGFPWSKRLAPGVVLVGLDSTRSDTMNPLRWAEGRLDEHDVDAAAEHLEALGDVTHRIIAMHHYPLNDFESLTEWVPMHFAEPDAATARNWLEWMGATSVLCGHIHDDRERRIRGGIKVFATDSNSYEFGDDELTGRSFRLLTYGPGGRVSSRIVEVNEDT